MKRIALLVAAICIPVVDAEAQSCGRLHAHTQTCFRLFSRPQPQVIVQRPAPVSQLPPQINIKMPEPPTGPSNDMARLETIAFFQALEGRYANQQLSQIAGQLGITNSQLSNLLNMQIQSILNRPGPVENDDLSEIKGMLELLKARQGDQSQAIGALKPTPIISPSQLNPTPIIDPSQLRPTQILTPSQLNPTPIQGPGQLRPTPIGSPGGAPGTNGSTTPPAGGSTPTGGGGISPNLDSTPIGLPGGMGGIMLQGDMKDLARIVGIGQYKQANWKPVKGQSTAQAKKAPMRTTPRHRPWPSVKR